MFDDDEDINNEETNDVSSDVTDEPADVPDTTDVSSEAEASSPSHVEGFENFDNEKSAEEEPAEEKPDPNTITVQPVQFASFEDLDQVQGPQNQNLNILLDVKLQLSVELGKAELPIKKF